jgi:hypothetical protein
VTAGRTTWHPRDAAEHDRELVVELGEEFGSSGPYLLTVLKDVAQQQRDGGEVRTGFKSLARKAFCNPSDARQIVERAAAIGAIDDLTIDEDGRRFTGRISGWVADQTRGNEAIRKAQQRAEQAPDTSQPDGTCPTEPGQAPPETGHVPHTRPDLTREEQTTTSSELAKATPDILRLSSLLADLIRQRDPKAKVDPESTRWLSSMRLLVADRHGDHAEVERVLRWSQADSFWQANILSPTKLREKFTQLLARMNGSPAITVVESEAEKWARREREWAEEERVA